MTIIPAEKSIAAHYVFRVLQDLLFWADAPHSEDLPNGWAASYRESVSEVLEAYMRSIADDVAAVSMAKRCQRVCCDFIGLMDNVPGLSKITRREWTVPSHQKVFDELAQLRDHFELASNETLKSKTVKQTSTQEATAITLVTTPEKMARRSKRDKTKKRWTVQEVEERIRLELKSSDSATQEKYLFATAEVLESWIGCDRKTAMKTPFWTEDRDELQKKWRRENTKKTGRKTQDI